jgi:hypothetical protein
VSPSIGRRWLMLETGWEEGFSGTTHRAKKGDSSGHEGEGVQDEAGASDALLVDDLEIRVVVCAAAAVTEEVISKGKMPWGYRKDLLNRQKHGTVRKARSRIVVLSLRNSQGIYGTGAKNSSQSTKAARSTAPSTTIKIM